MTLGHYVGKSEAQLRAGSQMVADFIEAAAAQECRTGTRHAETTPGERGRLDMAAGVGQLPA